MRNHVMLECLRSVSGIQIDEGQYTKTAGPGKVPTVFTYPSCSICPLGIGCDINLAMGRRSNHHCCLGR